MQKTKFFNPYNSDGTTNLSRFKGLAGVYIIKSKDGIFSKGEIKYIGYSGTNLYKTLTRHFQSWNDPKQIRVTFSKHSVVVRIIITTPAKAPLLEAALLKRHSPSDNPMQLKGRKTYREASILEESDTKPAIDWYKVEVPF